MSTGSIALKKLSPTERRKLVALGVHASKSNRAIAKELGVDEGTVRRDRNAFQAPVQQQPARMPELNLGKPKPALLAVEKKRSLGRQSMLEAVELWIQEEHMGLEEIELVLQGAGKRLYFRREAVRSLPAPKEKPSELIRVARPVNRDKDEIIPNPDFWADWLARWLALCLPRQEELQRKYCER